MTVPVKAPPVGDIMEAVLIKGDLSKLTPEERTRFYNETCKSIGLNPLTQPFEYITLNGKLKLYARRDAADQLRKLNGISVEIVSQEMQDGLLTVHVRAKDQTGRTDEDLGVVAFPESLRGELRANAILKAVTKAKRRVTLSISGLGFLDETEVDDIPEKGPQFPANGNGNGKTNGNGHISEAEQEELKALLEDANADSEAISNLCTHLGVKALDDLRPRHLKEAKEQIAIFKKWKAEQ